MRPSRRRAAGAPRPLPSDEGQMMILTAVILLAAFLALTAMLARVGNIASETQAERDDPFAQEFAALLRGIEAVIDDTDTTPAELENVFAHMEDIQSRRGYWTEIEATSFTACNPPSDPELEVVVQVQMQTADTFARKTITVTRDCP